VVAGAALATAGAVAAGPGTAAWSIDWCTSI